MASHPLRVLGSTALSLLIAASTGGPSLALSSPGDGAATPEACAALGYAAPVDQADAIAVTATRRSALAAARSKTAVQNAPVSVAPSQDRFAPPPPPPAPPPPPPASLSYGYAAPSPVMTGSFPAPVRDTEKYPGAAANPVKRVAEEPVSTFSIDVDTAAYANVRRFLNDNAAPPRDAVRVEELVNYFDYGYARPTAKEPPFKATVAVVPSPWSKDRQLLHIGVQG